MDDGRLLEAARAGDREALGSLLAAQYERCFAVCRRLLGDEEDARDATQEAMISIAKGIARFDGRSAFGTWCYRVAANAALDELRRRTRRPRLHVSGRGAEAERTDDPAELGLAAESATGRDTVADRVADTLAVGTALMRLPEDQRVAVVLRDLADLEYAEMAELLGVPLGTVRSRIARGRAALAELLDPGPSPAAPADRHGTSSHEGSSKPVTETMRDG